MRNAGSLPALALAVTLAALCGCSAGECEAPSPALKLRVVAGSGVKSAKLTTLELALTVGGSTTRRTVPLSGRMGGGSAELELHLGSGLSAGYQANLGLTARDADGGLQAVAQRRFVGQATACEILVVTLSPPQTCGNERIDPGELCDPPQLAGRTCKSEGLAGGALGCRAGCKALDLAGCRWVSTASGPDSDQVTAVALDASGNSVIAGVFAGTLIFGSTTLTATAGGADIFIAKLSAKGTPLWAKALTAPGANSAATDVALDSKGYSYLVGSFFGVLSHGSGSVSSKGKSDLMVAKFSPDGALVWIRSSGGAESDHAAGIAINSKDQIFVNGTIKGPLTFAPCAAGGRCSATTAGVSAVIARLNSEGQYVWVKTGPTVSTWEGGIAADAQGATCAFVSTTADATFDTHKVKRSTHTNTNVVVRLDAAGRTFSWARSLGGSAGSTNGYVAMDPWGNCYVVGTFAGALTLKDTTSGSPIAVPSKAKQDLLVARLEKGTGDVVWAASVAGPGDDGGSGISLDRLGNVYLTGGFGSGSVVLGKTTLKTTAKLRGLVAKLSGKNGAFVWATGPQGYSGGGDIVVDGAGNSRAVGYFVGTTSFGATTVAPPANGSLDLFVWNIPADGP